MTAEGFIASVAPSAVAAGKATGLWPSVVIAQWADETGWGTSPYWTQGHNPAGISPNGQVAAYPSVAAGIGAWVSTMLSGYYTGVRNTYGQGPLAQALALGRSPWAGGHYQLPGQAQGSALVAIIQGHGLTAYDGAPVPAPTPAPAPQPVPELTGPDMAAFDPISGGSWGVKPDGAVFSYDGAPYLGGLNSHPEWNTASVGTVAGIAAWRGDGTPAHGNGYVVYVSTPQGFALYRFPGDGSLVK